MGDQHRQDSLDSLDSFLTSVRGFGSKVKNSQAVDGSYSAANATFIQFEIPSGEFSIMDTEDGDEDDSAEILDTLSNLQKDLQAFGASIRIVQKKENEDDDNTTVGEEFPVKTETELLASTAAAFCDKSTTSSSHTYLRNRASGSLGATDDSVLLTPTRRGRRRDF